MVESESMAASNQSNLSYIQEAVIYTTQSVEPIESRISLTCTMIFLAIVVAINSILIILAILLYMEWKKLHLFLSLAISDLFRGLAVIAGGMWTLIRLYQGLLYTKTTAFECLLVPSTILNTFSYFTYSGVV